MWAWYLHLHDVSQPDLDWTNPNVREELANVVRFWKERGVAVSHPSGAGHSGGGCLEDSGRPLP
ncbi:alpha-amylase family glycosyl hydrolase [Selenomonas massiliensis]|uniref:alpha-amylase family glycosyl hydrolase n=1 Tax=Selenomonas massiliensis TaxID=2058293 RepID=UPI000D103044